MANDAILVLGATGNVGRHLVRAFAAEGRRVKAATRTPKQYPRQRHVEPIYFDFRDERTFGPALDEVERLFVVSPVNYVDSDALTAAFLDHALPRMRKVVTVTAHGVDADEGIPHRRLELRVQRSGVAYVLLRPNFFADNFHTYWRQSMRSRGTIELPAADSRAAFVDARDIAAAAAVTLLDATHDGQAFSLTGPAGLDYHEAAAVLSRASGQTYRYRAIDDATFRTNLVHDGFTEDYAALLSDIFGLARMGLWAEPTSAVEALTGRCPLSLTDYATKYAGAWRE